MRVPVSEPALWSRELKGRGPSIRLPSSEFHLHPLIKLLLLLFTGHLRAGPEVRNQLGGLGPVGEGGSLAVRGLLVPVVPES